MAYIRLVEESEATGALKTEYDLAIRRSGRVWNIIKTMSPNPAVLKASMDMYLKVMFAQSPLSRAQREMVAVIVSATNDCYY